MDDIAARVGCKVDLWKLFKADPLLSLRCIFGPCVPSQYRLEGPGKWNGAKASIEGATTRYSVSLRTKVMPKNQKKTDLEMNSDKNLFLLSLPFYMKSFTLFILFAMIVLCTCLI